MLPEGSDTERLRAAGRSRGRGVGSGRESLCEEAPSKDVFLRQYVMWFEARLWLSSLEAHRRSE